MRHPTEGVLRRLLDEPVGVADSDREHVADCPQCLGGLAAMREDAALVDAALATEGGAGVDVAAAWRRLSTAAPAAGPGRAASPGAGRSRGVLRRPVVAALAVAIVLTGAGTAAANDWLQIFRTERIAPVSLSTADLNALPDLRAYGEVVVTGDGDVHQVPDAAAAAAETGLDVPEVTTLPRGVSGEPVYQVGGEVSATFTFSADRAARAAAEAGESLPPLPPGLVVLRRDACPRWRSRRRPGGVLLRSVVRDGARLPVVVAGPARGRRGAAAHVHRGRLDPAAARARRPGHHVL